MKVTLSKNNEATADSLADAFSTLGGICALADENHHLFIERMVGYVCEATGSDFAVFNSFEFEQNQIITQYGHKTPTGFRRFGRLKGRVCYEILSKENGNQVVFDDLLKTSYAVSDPDIKRFQISSYMGTALHRSGQPIGSLALYNVAPREYTDRHRQLARLAAQMIAANIERHDMREGFRRKKRHDQLLSAVSEKALATHDRSFLDFCLDTIGRDMGVDAAILFPYDEETQLFGPDNRYWTPHGPTKRISVDNYGLLTIPFVREVISSHKPYAARNMVAIGDTTPHMFFRDYHIVSLLILPIVNQESIYGLFLLCTQHEERLWEEGDLDTLTALMGVIAHWQAGRAISDQLDESQALINQLFQLSPTAIYRIDFRKRRLVTFNEMVLRASGYSEEELRSMDAAEFLAPESRKVFIDRILAVAAGNSVPSDVEFQIQTKSGEIEWGHFHTRYLYEDGQVCGANVVAHIVTDQKRALEELGEYRKRLEAIVDERTRELSLANEKLTVEVARRTETARELRLKSDRLKELNTAMRVLLDKRNEERLRSEENIRVNLVQLIEPYLDRLDNSGLNEAQSQLLEVIRMNLNEVIGSPMPELSAKYYIFSPSELQVANLIRKGRTTKEMAKLLNISSRTVESYRNSIRKKLGLKNKKVNLKTYLSSKE